MIIHHYYPFTIVHPNTENWKINRLRSSCTVYFLYQGVVCPDPDFIDWRTRGPVDLWPGEPVDLWASGPVDSWTRGPVDPWARGLVDPWTREPVDSWTCAPLDSLSFAIISHYSPLFTIIHQYSPYIHQYSPLFTIIHHYSPFTAFAIIHHYSPYSPYSPMFANTHY